MFFDFQDGHPDIQRIAPAMTVREGVLVAIIVHLLAVIAILVVPEIPWVKARMLAAERARVAAAEAELTRRQEQRPFIFVQPKVDLEALKPPPRAPLSDLDRQAMTYERPPEPTNEQPFSRGNTRQFEEATPPSAAPPLGSPTPVPPQMADAGSGSSGERPSEPGEGYILPNRGTNGRGREGATAPQPVPFGSASGLKDQAGRLLRELEQTRGQFDNPTGGGQRHGAFQFDSKGVDFGWWLARLRRQVYAAWEIPDAAMFLRGHVGFTIKIARDGRIYDIVMVEPSAVQGFNHAAFGALVGASPAPPLPAEFPDAVLPMRVTFYYNEEPPSQYTP